MKPKADMEYKKVLAERLKRLRQDTGLSQNKFAESIGVTRVHYNRMESLDVEMMPSKPLLEHICATYDINRDWLINGNGPMYTYQEENTSTVDENSILENADETEYIINDSTLNNTLEFFDLKTRSLAVKDSMDTKSFFYYFQFVNAVFHLVFRMLRDVREYYSGNTQISDSFHDTYTEELKSVLNEVHKKKRQDDSGAE